LSVNAVSLIEKGENSPTVASLHRLAEALGTSITDFFEDQARQTAVLVKHDSRLTVERNGIRMGSLGMGLERQRLEPFVVTVEPGAGTDQPVTHPGQEFVLCAQGTCTYCVADRDYHLSAGDSLLFHATQPHCFRNGGDSPAELLIVFESTEDLSLARQVHLADETSV
jgi:quercetin dioxygenase-like cupin family protein